MTSETDDPRFREVRSEKIEISLARICMKSKRILAYFFREADWKA